jgi:hypothetical protein
MPAFVGGDGFHLLNAWLFGLFIFPWLMIVRPRSSSLPTGPSGLLARAWHMKLRDKQGTATFRVGEGSSVVTVDPADHLNDHQLHRLPGHPERLVHFARHLSTLHDGAPVRVDTSVSLNGRRPQAIVDPDVDLTTVPLVSWGRRSWVLPLGEPLRPTALAR